MPEFDQYRRRRVYLKDVRQWHIGTLDSFAIDHNLLAVGVSEQDQRELFILRAARNMGGDGYDNTDAQKAHPAMIQDPVAREEASIVTQKMLVDLVSLPRTQPIH